MPFALQDYNAIRQAMDGKLLRADLEKAGYLTTDKILDSGFHQMTSSSKPINTVEDMRDLVMDSFNQAGVDVRNDMVGLIDQTKVFLAEKGMIV